LTSTKADRQALESGVSVDVVAIVVRVSDLDRSLKFYCDVFSCRVAVREADMALLLTPQGFEIYLHRNDEFHSRARLLARDLTVSVSLESRDEHVRAARLSDSGPATLSRRAWRTPTRTPTSSILGVLAGVSRCSQNALTCED
jgi:hypothetical protein